MRPTAEQTGAVDLFLTGRSLKINAFAGSGKTSTLLFIAAATAKPGVYFAFNSAIAREARAKFPPHVATSTLHAFAYRRVPAAFRRNPAKLTGDLNANAVAELLRLEPIVAARDCWIGPRMLGAMVKATVQGFCQSDASRPDRGHVPRWGRTAELPAWTFRRLSTTVAGHAAALWERMIDPASPAPLGHDGYFKLWALGDPRLDAAFILLDEAQDSSAAVVRLLARQDAQVVYVGDRYQQIYAWRGAVNAMDRVRTRHRVHLTQSFRFGPAVAEAASRVLRVLGERRAIRGNPAIASRLRCDVPDAVLCRTNATVLAAAMNHLAGGRRVAIVGGGRELAGLLDAVERLQSGHRVNRPAFFGYRIWRDVEEAAERGEGADLVGLVRLVRRYGVPDLRRCLGALSDDEGSADVVVSTVHKAKGREWRGVHVADDFSSFRRRSRGRTRIVEEDVRLFYVAITRAREALQLPGPLAARFGIRRGVGSGE